MPQVTSQAPWDEKPSTCFNIGVTFEGLRALGATGETLASFPTEFVEGMTARAPKLGDIGDGGRVIQASAAAQLENREHENPPATRLQ